MELASCSLCADPGLVRINDSWFCLAHVDDGFRLLARGLAILRGVDPDKVETAAVEMVEEVLHRMRETLTEDHECPECGSENVDIDPPYALCQDCGWQGLAE